VFDRGRGRAGGAGMWGGKEIKYKYI
jgi:hypothetical protein